MKTTYHEHADGSFSLNVYQDVEPHIEYAKACARADAEARGKFGKRGDLRRILSIPMNVLLAVAQRLGIPAGQIFEVEYNRRIVAELKRAEFKVFRTTTDKHL